MTRDELLKAYFSQPRFPVQAIVDFVNLDKAGQDATLKTWATDYAAQLGEQIAANSALVDQATTLKTALEAL